MTHRLRKAERLSAKKDIDALFSEGHTMRSGPLVLKFGLMPSALENARVQVLFSVPKRYIRLATKRNMVKRLMREVYRQQKTLWSTWNKEDEGLLLLAFIYNQTDVMDYLQLKSHYDTLRNKAQRHSKPLPKLLGNQ